MPPAPRPITSRGRPTSSRQQHDHPPSSLDILFSYSRSAQFYSEAVANASNPSFIDDRRWRGRSGTDEEEGAGAITGTEEETTTDSREPQTTTTDDEEWTGEEADGDEEAAPWFDGRSGAEQLPPNALPAPSSSTPTHPAQRGRLDTPASEHTPLLGRGPPPSASPSLGFRPSSAHLTANRERRPSTFKEEWKAKIEEHRGESSWGQTLFNTINVLIGVGLLADPLAFADSGWVLGVALLLFCSFVTFYTALLLARLMRLHPSSHTYADVLIRAYGPWTRSLIYFLFVLELSTFSVAAVELFADSMASLYPKIGVVVFKVVAFGILLPTTFLPLRLLSLTSLLGILSSIVLLGVIISDGVIKPTAPGSLREVMPTSWGPRWGRFPLSFGLFMSGFSGHAVVPSLYRDMKNPRHFASMAAVAFLVAFIVSLVFGVLGYLMFGNLVSPEITRDLSSTPGYPIWLNRLAVWMVAINPLVKYAIANKPLVQTFEHLIGLHPKVEEPAPTPPSTEGERVGRPLIDESAIATNSTSFSRRSSAFSPPARSSSALSPRRNSTSSLSPRLPHPPPAPEPRKTRLIRYFLLRPGITALCAVLAILIPEFDRVLAFLGSASAFVICVILPVGAYLISGRQEEEKVDAESKGTRRASLPEVGGIYGGMAANKIVAERAREVQAAQDARAERRREIRAGLGGAGAGGEGLHIAAWEKTLCWVVLLVSVGLAVVGTVWSFLPVKEAGLRSAAI
ncbi:hypothetical protein JCM11251_007343 [Rhodosporidiobolus azoricus]